MNVTVQNKLHLPSADRSEVLSLQSYSHLFASGAPKKHRYTRFLGILKFPSLLFFFADYAKHNDLCPNEVFIMQFAQQHKNKLVLPSCIQKNCFCSVLWRMQLYIVIQWFYYKEEAAFSWIWTSCESIITRSCRLESICVHNLSP